VELITTHIGADFDALASSLIARKLYPEAQLFFPGSREESVRRMLDSGFIELSELRQRQIDPDRLSRVILCDIRQRDRIGVVADWLAARPGIELVIYDHHPAGEDDLEAAAGKVDPAAGSTSTLLVEELAEHGIELSPREASLMLIFATTGPRDLAAAAWLLERGGDLAVVRRYALRRLDARRLEVLHRMTDELKVYRLRGHRVGIVALELGVYIDELAPLVGRCVELFELPLVFAVFGEAERVTVIARGELQGMHLGRFLAEHAGGGGHATAAAASVRGQTVLEVRERLLEGLEASLPSGLRARDLMLSEFHVLPADETVEAAKRLLNRHRLNAAPVVAAADSRKVVGVVTRQGLDAALQHELGERRVEAVMERDLEWVPAEAPAEEIAARMMGRHPRLVLVGDPAAPLGVATRMQVLRHLYGRLEETTDPLGRRARERRARRADVGRLLRDGPAEPVARRLALIGEVARRHDVRAYLVGGLVRDLLLGRDNRDIDLVVEGDGPHFARLLCERLGGRVREYRPFMTAVLVEEGGFHIDVASARSEFYRAPAALPEVRTSPIRQDLYRRDFTINTLAIRLGPDETAELIDFFGGRRDLDDQILRVLHSLSFIDDPTRVLRGVRLECRLGFDLSPETLRLVDLALAEGVFERLSGPRLRDELMALLDDPATALKGVERLAGLGLLAVLHPDLIWNQATRDRFSAAAAAVDWRLLGGMAGPPVKSWRLFLAALAWDLGAQECRRLADRLALGGGDTAALGAFRGRVEAALDTLAAPGLEPHAAAAALEPLSEDEILLVMALGDESQREWVRRQLIEVRSLDLAIRGADLVARGVPSGPVVGRALAATRDARIDGRIGRDQELEFALAVAADEPVGGGRAG
jgi:tRNA nucleotidyltransferase (CCA-adding enzyme)